MNTDFIPNDAVAVTPSDSAIVDGYAFMVATEGDVAVKTARGNNVTLPGCLVGVQYVIKFTRILDTGTTPTSVIVFR